MTVSSAVALVERASWGDRAALPAARTASINDVHEIKTASSAAALAHRGKPSASPALPAPAGARECARSAPAPRREVDLNPRSWAAHFAYGFVLNYGKDHAAAVDAFREAISVSPTLASTYVSLAIPEAARGNVESERRLFAEIDAAVRSGKGIGVGGRAFLHLAVGEHAEALDWLRQGAEKAARHEHDAGFYQLMNLKLNYAADPVLDRPEFVEVRNRLVGD